MNETTAAALEALQLPTDALEAFVRPELEVQAVLCDLEALPSSTVFAVCASPCQAVKLFTTQAFLPRCQTAPGFMGSAAGRPASDRGEARRWLCVSRPATARFAVSVPLRRCGARPCQAGAASWRCNSTCRRTACACSTRLTEAAAASQRRPWFSWVPGALLVLERPCGHGFYSRHSLTSGMLRPSVR